MALLRNKEEFERRLLHRKFELQDIQNVNHHNTHAFGFETVKNKVYDAHKGVAHAVGKGKLKACVSHQSFQKENFAMVLK